MNLRKHSRPMTSRLLKTLPWLAAFSTLMSVCIHLAAQAPACPSDPATSAQCDEPQAIQPVRSTAVAADDRQELVPEPLSSDRNNNTGDERNGDTPRPREVRSTPVDAGENPAGTTSQRKTPKRRDVPAQPSEFELFAQDAAGSLIPMYGRDLFTDVPSTFAPVDQVPVPASYVLGPGDQLLIRIWGKITLSTTVTVDRSGQIFVPKVGAITVAGLHYEEIQKYIESAVGSLYKGFELNVSMGQLRSIQIFVLGSARRPGVYTVSSLSTLVNALFASGGPSSTGSMRRIQLRRANQLLVEFDLYDLLRIGDKSHDVQLLAGDVIYIPPVGAQVAILGSVNEPAIYELKDQETVASAIRYAAGVNSLAGTDRVLLERIDNHKVRRVDDFPLDAAGMQRELKDGDMLRIFPISPKFENAVTLRGSVQQAGRYPFHEGMHISDLIRSRDFLVTRNYWTRLNRNGRLDQKTTASASQDLDVLADLNKNNAEINWEYAAIERLDDHDLSTRVIPFNLGRAVDDPQGSDNQRLKPGDVISIFSRKDLPVPQDQHAAFVQISGEVRAPGVYRIEPGESLRELIERAGGLTSHSYLYASQLTRPSIRMAQEKELQVSINQMQRELTSRYAGAKTLVSTSPTEQQAQMTQQQAVIAQLSSVQPTGRIVLDMQPHAGVLSDVPDFPLEDGDSFFVPPLLNTIQVAGAVYNESAFRYQAGKPLSAYLNDAGGATRQADRARIFLVRADGTIISKQGHHTIWGSSFENLNVLPGDSIVVPTKLKSPNNFLQQLPALAQILSQAATTGAVIGTR